MASKQQAVDTGHGLTETHILYSSDYFHVCAAFLLSCWPPAVSEGGSHVRCRAAKVSFLDQRLNSWDIMSYSAATLPLTATHLPHHRNLDCVSMADCLPAAVSEDVSAVLGWVKTWANEVSLLFHFEKITSLSPLPVSRCSNWFFRGRCSHTPWRHMGMYMWACRHTSAHCIYTEKYVSGVLLHLLNPCSVSTQCPGKNSAIGSL